MKAKKLVSMMLAFALLMSGCGKKVEPKGSEGGAASSGAVLTTSTSTAASGEAGSISSENAKKNVQSMPLKIGTLFSPQDTMDPSTVTSPGGMVVMYSVYDSLATMEEDGVHMRMAEAIQANADATAYTIKLRAPLLFSDGSEVMGEDVVKSLQYLAKSPMYQSMLSNVDTEKCSAKGKEATIVLKTGATDFIESALSMFSPIGKAGEYKGIGAGAYTVAKGDAQTGYVLKANPKYYAGAPAIPEVTMLNVPDAASKVKALQTGEIDYAWGLDGAAIQLLSKEKDIELPEGKLAGAMAMELVLNTRVKPFDDPEVRRAAKLAVDREKLVKTILGKYGQIGNDMLGKGYPTYPNDVEQTKVNKEEAKRIFATKGIKEFKVISSDTTPGLNKATEMMVQDFKDVGVKVIVEEKEPQSFFSNMKELYATPAFTFYWINRTPLAEFRSQVKKESPFNASGFSTKTTEENFVKATTSKDPKIQEDAIRALSKEIHDEGGDLIWGYQMDISAKRKGFNAPITHSVPWLAEATFIPESK